MANGVKFMDSNFAPTNIQQPRGRSSEQAEVERDLMAVEGHVGQDVQMVRTQGGDVVHSRDLAGKPTEDALTVLQGRGVGVKPQLGVKPNYIGASGVGSGSLVPNTPNGVTGPEDLDS